MSVSLSPRLCFTCHDRITAQTLTFCKIESRKIKISKVFSSARFLGGGWGGGPTVSNDHGGSRWVDGRVLFHFFESNGIQIELRQKKKKKHQL